MGWEWSGRFVKAEATQIIALEMIKGLPGEAAIRKDLARYTQLADRRHSAGADWVASRHPPKLALTEAKPYRRIQPKKPKSMVSGLWVVGILVLALRGFLGTSHSSSTSNNYNYPGYEPPRSITLTWSEFKRKSTAFKISTVPRKNRLLTTSIRPAVRISH